MWRNGNGSLILPYFKDCGFSGLGDGFENSSFVFWPGYSPGDCTWIGLLVCFIGVFLGKWLVKILALYCCE